MKFLFFFFLCTLQMSCFALLSRQIALGNSLLTVEIADHEESRKLGLMFRAQLPEGYGMLFIEDKPKILSFWMKNTYIPLSIGFFDKDYQLLNIEDMPPCQEGKILKSFKSSSPAVYALEVPQGWFAKQNIKPGMKFSFRDP
jgi:Uncharacterized conserved protein